ncbi:MAG: DUF2752 domain-containing protein [Sphingobacteriia bacterium]|nr:DUF2752 domain-containing protein [Sphingobacteriia bacterium]
MLNWLEAHLLPCAYKQLLGISCPLCGSQRAVILLLQGRIWKAIMQFPPLPIIIFTIGFLIVERKHLTKKQYQPIIFFNLIILFLNCIYQNLYWK